MWVRPSLSSTATLSNLICPPHTWNVSSLPNSQLRLLLVHHPRHFPTRRVQRHKIPLWIQMKWHNNVTAVSTGSKTRRMHATKCSRSGHRFTISFVWRRWCDVKWALQPVAHFAKNRSASSTFGPLLQLFVNTCSEIVHILSSHNGFALTPVVRRHNHFALIIVRRISWQELTAIRFNKLTRTRHVHTDTHKHTQTHFRTRAML